MQIGIIYFPELFITFSLHPVGFYYIVYFVKKIKLNHLNKKNRLIYLLDQNLILYTYQGIGVERVRSEGTERSGLFYL